MGNMSIDYKRKVIVDTFLYKHINKINISARENVQYNFSK